MNNLALISELEQLRLEGGDKSGSLGELLTQGEGM